MTKEKKSFKSVISNVACVTGRFFVKYKYFFAKIGVAILTLSLSVVLLFFLLRMIPGDIVELYALKLQNQQGITYDRAYELASQLLNYNPNEDVFSAFFRYVGGLFRGQLGESYLETGVSANSLIATRLPISIRIGGAAVSLGAVVGLILGLIAALRHDTWVDTLCTVISVIGVSVPSYVFALLLSYQLGFNMKLFPMLFDAKRAMASSVLPSISLSMFTMASIARFTRSEMMEVLDSDYMLLAESKGISGFALIFRHALRNALIPIITVLAPLIVDLMTGSLVVEKIFAIPGVGSLLVNAIQSNDYNVVISLAFIYSAMYIGIMLVVDILYGIIDPRIRLAKDGK